MATVETVKIVFDVESKELTDTTKQLVDLGKVVDDDAAKFKKLNAEAGNSEKAFTSLRTQVKQAKDEVVRLSDEFGEFSAEANAARARAGQLADQMSDLNRQVNLLNPEAKAKAFVNFGQGVVGAFQVATGALQAFGAENEEVQKIAMRLQGALNVVQGIASIKQLKEAYQDVKVVLGVTTAAQNTLNGATAAGGAAAGGAATGFRALTAAMVANPFTAIAVAIGAVVGALILLNDTENKVAEDEKKRKQEREDYLKTLKGEAELIELRNAAIGKGVQGARQELELIRARGASSKEVFAAEQKLRQEELNELIRIKAFLGDNLEDEKERLQLDIEISNKRNQIRAASLAYDKKLQEEGVKAAEKAEADRLKALQDNQAKIDAARAAEDGLRAQREQQLNSELAEIDKQAELQKLANQANFYGDKEALRVFDLKAENDAIDAKLQKLKDFGKQDSSQYQELLAKRVKLNKEAEAAQTEDTKKAEKERDAIRQKINQEYADFTFEAISSYTDLFKTGLDEQTQSEIESIEARKEAGLITEEAYQAGLKKIRQKNAEDTKKFQIFAGLLNAAQAILAALNTPPNPLDPTAQIRAVAFASILSAANLAKIIATPIPKFKEGTLNFQGGKMDSDGGALAILHPNEAVIPADRNRAYHPTLEAIYKKQIKPSELNAFVLNKLAGKGSIGRDTEITASIDTYALSRAIGKNKTVHLGNAEAVGNVIAKKLLGAYNIRRS